MTGLGEEVYEDRSAALDALVEESERLGLYGSAPDSNHIGGITEMVEKASRTLAERHWIDKTAMGAHRPVAMAEYVGRTWRCFSEDARAALESLGIPLTVLADVIAERKRQNEQWGRTEHDDLHRPSDWEDYIIQQIRKAEKETSDIGYRRHLVNVIALGLAAVGSWDRTHAQKT